MAVVIGNLAVAATWCFAFSGFLIAMGSIAEADWLSRLGVMGLAGSAVFAGVLGLVWCTVLVLRFLALPFTALMERR